MKTDDCGFILFARFFSILNLFDWLPQTEWSWKFPVDWKKRLKINETLKTGESAFDVFLILG